MFNCMLFFFSAKTIVCNCNLLKRNHGKDFLCRTSTCSATRLCWKHWNCWNPRKRPVQVENSSVKLKLLKKKLGVVGAAAEDKCQTHQNKERCWHKQVYAWNVFPEVVEVCLLLLCTKRIQDSGVSEPHWGFRCLWLPERFVSTRGTVVFPGVETLNCVWRIAMFCFQISWSILCWNLSQPSTFTLMLLNLYKVRWRHCQKILVVRQPMWHKILVFFQCELENTRPPNKSSILKSFSLRR